MSETNIFAADPGELSVAILVLPDSNLMALAACIEPMREANRLAGGTAFRWRLFSPTGGEVVLSSRLPLATEPLTTHIECDLLIVVAGFNLIDHTPSALIRQLDEIAPEIRAIGGVDGGTWVLARAGLLNGQTATVNLDDLEEFADVFPKINVVRDRFTISGKLFTSSGAAPTIDLMLYLIRARHGPRLADGVAAALVYESAPMARRPELPTSTVRLERNAPKLARAVRIMGESLAKPMDASEIARMLGLSQRSLEVMFQKHLGQSPAACFLRMRLQEARRLVLETPLGLNEVASSTGFSSPAVFARAFRRQFGMSASALRRLHRR
ncbi:MAG: GlxA family transcriptional regulator [Rhodobacteraceae bacterium]|nr:GlxA family transcriptional regulator [Paracoccaceae bacterium]